MLGEILHDVMKKLYNDYIGKVLTAEVIDLIIRDKPLIERNNKELQSMKNSARRRAGLLKVMNLLSEMF